jgi:hypothetical protein
LRRGRGARTDTEEGLIKIVGITSIDKLRPEDDPRTLAAPWVRWLITYLKSRLGNNYRKIPWTADIHIGWPEADLVLPAHIRKNLHMAEVMDPPGGRSRLPLTTLLNVFIGIFDMLPLYQRQHNATASSVPAGQPLGASPGRS